jgi:hypothetical protein
MIKKLEELTLKEYDQYKELLADEDFNIFPIMSLLGYENPEDMDIREFNILTHKIINEEIITPQVKQEYTINGRIFHTVMMIKDIHAAQFTDFQTYMVKYKLNNILSVFMLPVNIKKNIFRRNVREVMKYNDGYDMMEVQEFLYNNFTIGDALALSSFFLNLSMVLLPVFRNSLMVEATKAKVSMKRSKLKQLKRK